jgi:hypothetical protein
MAVDTSGTYQDAAGRPFLVTQGLAGYTLVAGKQCLLRMFLNANELAQADYLRLRVDRPPPAGPLLVFATQNQLLFESAAPNGPSVGVIVRGSVFPTAGAYGVTLELVDPYGAVTVAQSLGTLSFRPTRDLRLLVVFLVKSVDDGGFPPFAPTPEWTTDVTRAMVRLGSMFPVRDCVLDRVLLPDRCHGIQYAIGQPCDGYVPIGDYYDCVYKQTRAINAATRDVYLTVEYRPGFYFPDYNPPGDPSPGGNSSRPPPPYGDLRRASCVSGTWRGIPMTAPCLAQEIGHNFGLEPPGSPHFQDRDDPGHSKDPQLFDPHAFDFVNQRPYFPLPPGSFLGDVMNNLGRGAWQGADQVLFNAYDWEYLRTQLMLLDSTGTDVNPCSVDPCAPARRTLPRSPAEVRSLVGSRAGGPLWEWTPRGFRPVPPRPSDLRRARFRNDNLLDALRQLERDGVEELYLPVGDEALGLVAEVAPPSSLHRRDLPVDRG